MTIFFAVALAYLTGFFVALVFVLALCRAASDADKALGYKDEEGPKC